MAYVLGFLYADGNMVRSKRGNYYVSIYTADRGILEKIKLLLSSNHKISSTKSKTGIVYRMQIGSRHMFETLEKIGLKTNKVSRLVLPNIPKKYKGDFIRGYFDGDGSVWVGNDHSNRALSSKTMQVCYTSASHDFLNDLHILHKKMGIIGGSLFKSKKGNYSRLLFSIKDSLKIYKIMYNDENSIYLPRKKAIFELFMKMRP